MKKCTHIIILLLLSYILSAQTFTVGSTCCNYHLVNKTFTFPSTNGMFWDHYYIDIDGDLTNDINLESFYFYCAPQPSGPCMGQWGRYIKAITPNSVEFICGPAASTSCSASSVIKNVPFGTVLNSSSNWTYSPISSIIYSADVSNPFCGQFSNPFYIGFRKILPSSDTIFGWIKMDSNYPGKVIDYAYSCGTYTGSPTPSTITTNSAILCDGDSVQLTATPSGGIFTGVGVSGNYFKANNLASGVYTVNYTIPNLSGCSTISSNVTFTVNKAAITNTESVLCVGGNLNLTAIPPGGVFTGSNVTGNVFSPTTVGNYNIIYTYTNAAGCNISASKNITVKSSAITNTLTTMCTGETMVITTVTSGGNFTGTIWPSSPLFQPTSAGTYTVSYNLAGCASSSITITVSACIGIHEYETYSSQFSIFPNPNSGEFEIKGIKEEIIFISNELGQLIDTKKLNRENNYSIKINNLQNGVYFVGNKFSRQKVVMIK